MGEIKEGNKSVAFLLSNIYQIFDMKEGEEEGFRDVVYRHHWGTNMFHSYTPVISALALLSFV